MTRTISEEDIAALVAVRSVIADAAHHPGRQAAIEAIERLESAPVTVTHAPIDPDEFDAGLQRILDALVAPGGPTEAAAPGCADCEKRKQADDRFMRQMLGPSELALEEPPHDDGCRCTACCREKFSKQSALRPPEELVGALHDRIHPTSGPLLSATPIATQRHVRHQLFDSTCEAVKHWECSDCGDAAVSAPTDLRYPCGRCGGWMTRTWANPKCHVCGGRLRWESAVDMNLICNGGVRTVTTCGADECRAAAMRTNQPADKPQLFAVKWTNPDGKSGLGAERAPRAYLERSHNEVPRQEGWTYEIVPAPEGDKEWKFERDFVPVGWLDETRALIFEGTSLALHGRCDADCWKCRAVRYLESL